jgi:hypothetical protein
VEPPDLCESLRHLQLHALFDEAFSYFHIASDDDGVSLNRGLLLRGLCLLDIL